MSKGERPFPSIRFAAESALSLGRDPKDLPLAKYRTLYEANANSREVEPLNREELLLPRFFQVLHDRGIKPPYSEVPYWAPGKVYDPFDVFGVLIQCVDQHNAPLPAMVLPPEPDVRIFVDQVFSRDKKVTVDQQLEILLDITENNIVGAANLVCIATRLLARGADRRAYPNIHVGEKEILFFLPPCFTA